jgi:putative MFS transporter
MNWMPSLLNGLGYNTKDSQFMTVFGLFGAPFGIFIASLIMDKISRKVMGVCLLAGMAVFGIIIGVVTSSGAVGMTGLIALTFLMNTIIYMYVCYASAVYVPEMWPTSAKLSGSGFSNAMGRVSNVLFPFLVTALASKSSSYVFILLAIVASIIAVAVIFLGVETRGESVEAIGDVE